MLKNKTFWVGFFVGYFLIIFVPQTNILGVLNMGKGRTNG